MHYNLFIKMCKNIVNAFQILGGDEFIVLSLRTMANKYVLCT